MRSLLSCDAELFLLWITKKFDVSSAKSFAMDEVPSVKSFMWIRKNSGPRIEPCGTPVLIFSYPDVYPFRTTLWNFDGKFLISCNKSPEIPNDLILNIKPGNQVLSNALDISKNTLVGHSRNLKKFHGL